MDIFKGLYIHSSAANHDVYTDSHTCGRRCKENIEDIGGEEVHRGIGLHRLVWRRRSDGRRNLEYRVQRHGGRIVGYVDCPCRADIVEHYGCSRHIADHEDIIRPGCQKIERKGNVRCKCGGCRDRIHCWAHDNERVRIGGTRDRQDRI